MLGGGGLIEERAFSHLPLARCILWILLVITDASKLNLVPLGQKGVEPEDELTVPFKELLHSMDDAGSVDLLSFELLHDLEEGVINVLVVSKPCLDLPQIRESCKVDE